MSFSPTDYQGMSPQNRYDDRGQFQLTPEEQRILKECSKEGIIQRAIPLGMLFGTIGYFAAKAGPFMSKKYGVKPAIVGCSALGYFLGRFSYSKVCIHRALEVPDGNLRKIFPQLQQKNRPYADTPDAYYATIDVPKSEESARAEQSLASDIDIPSISSIDTVPSEYYKTNEDNPQDEITPKYYTSYDDLRQQNRQEFSKRYYTEMKPPQRYPNQPQNDSMNRRPTQERQSALPSGPIGGQRTKYGDAWES